MDKRESERAQRRVAREAARKRAYVRTKVKEARVGAALDQTRTIFGDGDFRGLLWSQGVRDIPKLQPAVLKGVSSDGFGPKGQKTLAFAAAWLFLFPLLDNKNIRNHLTENWPDFIPLMKDAFIELVVDGPFPQDLAPAFP